MRLPGITLPEERRVCGVLPAFGGLEVLVDLEMESIEVLKGDEEFARFAEWMGMWRNPTVIYTEVGVMDPGQREYHP